MGYFERRPGRLVVPAMASMAPDWAPVDEVVLFAQAVNLAQRTGRRASDQATRATGVSVSASNMGLERAA